MAVQAVAFTKLYIAPVQSVPSPDDFLQVGNIFNIGDLGMSFNEIATSDLSDGFDRTLKGTVKVVSFPVILNYDPSDLGQALFRTAGENTENELYNFKVTYNDTITTPSTWTFKGKVMGFLIKGGGPNDVRKVDSGISVEMDTLDFTAAA